MQYLKADTITEVTVGPAVAVGDGFTPVTTLVGATADEFELIKHGATTTTTIAGTLAAITGADGYYALDLSATDTNTEGRLTLLINDDSLILPIRHDFMVVNANVYDSLFAAAATDYLQVDQLQLGGSTQSATDLKQFADDGYNPATSKVQGVVLVDTTTTNTDMVAAAPTAAAVADAVWDEPSEDHVTNGTPGRALVGAAYMGPNGLGVYFDDAAANTNTVTGTDGTVDNPVSDAAASLTIAVALGVRRVYITNDSAYTVSGTLDGYEIIGIGSATQNSVVIAEKDISYSTFRNLSVSAASAFGGVVDPVFIDCILGSYDVFGGIAIRCALTGTITLPAILGARAVFDDCYAYEGTTPILVHPGNWDTTAQISNYSNSIDIRGMTAANDKVEISGNGHIIIASSCTGGTIDIRGNFSTADSSAGTTVTETANLNTTNFATPTNITAGTITTATNLTNLPAITANWLTAAGLDAGAATEIANAVHQTQMTESYNTDGTAPTLEQALHLIIAYLTERSVSGTTVTAKQLDGSTTAATFTLNSSTAPTSVTRAS